MLFLLIRKYQPILRHNPLSLFVENFILFKFNGTLNLKLPNLNFEEGGFLFPYFTESATISRALDIIYNDMVILEDILTN